MPDPKTTRAETQASELVAPRPVRTRPGLAQWHFVWWGGLYLLASFALYFPYLSYLWDVWTTVPEYKHGVLLPLFSAFMLWERRRKIAQSIGSPSWVAIGLGVAGSASFLVGTVLNQHLTVGVSLILFLLGGLLALGGYPLFRQAWFPFAFLVFGIPLPDGILIGSLGDPLRDQAARWSARLLEMLGYSVFLEGTLLHLPRMTLKIAYECSGIRGLIAAVPLAAAFAYSFHRQWWERALLLAIAVPIGLVSNVLRVVAIAIRVYDFGVTPTPSELHGPTGWIPTLFIVPSLIVTSEVIRWADRRLRSG